jgi:hypothetical protein
VTIVTPVKKDPNAARNAIGSTGRTDGSSGISSPDELASGFSMYPSKKVNVESYQRVALRHISAFGAVMVSIFTPPELLIGII